MDIKLLLTFKTIISEGSFVNAAEKLNYSQATITSHIQQFEALIGSKLFERIGHKMILTGVGEEIQGYVDDVLQAEERLRRFVENRDGLSGSLKVAIPETLLTYLIQPIIKRFKEMAPEVKLSFTVMNCYQITQCVEDGTVDIGIHYNVGNYPETIDVSLIQEHDVALFGPATDHTLLEEKTIKCYLTSDVESIYHKRAMAYFAKENYVLDDLIEVGSTEAIKRSITSGLGITYLPKFVAEHELLSNQLKVMPSGIRHEPIESVYIMRKNKWVSPAMLLFIDELRKLDK